MQDGHYGYNDITHVATENYNRGYWNGYDMGKAAAKRDAAEEIKRIADKYADMAIRAMHAERALDAIYAEAIKHAQPFAS